MKTPPPKKTRGGYFIIRLDNMSPTGIWGCFLVGVHIKRKEILNIGNVKLRDQLPYKLWLPYFRTRSITRRRQSIVRHWGQ